MSHRRNNSSNNCRRIVLNNARATTRAGGAGAGGGGGRQELSTATSQLSSSLWSKVRQGANGPSPASDASGKSGVACRRISLGAALRSPAHGRGGDDSVISRVMSMRNGGSSNYNANANAAAAASAVFTASSSSLERPGSALSVGTAGEFTPNEEKRPPRVVQAIVYRGLEAEPPLEFAEEVFLDRAREAMRLSQVSDECLLCIGEWCHCLAMRCLFRCLFWFFFAKYFQRNSQHYQEELLLQSSTLYSHLQQQMTYAVTSVQRVNSSENWRLLLLQHWKDIFISQLPHLLAEGLHLAMLDLFPGSTELFLEAGLSAHLDVDVYFMLTGVKISAMTQQQMRHHVFGHTVVVPPPAEPEPANLHSMRRKLKSHADIETANGGAATAPTHLQDMDIPLRQQRLDTSTPVSASLCAERSPKRYAHARTISAAGAYTTSTGHSRDLSTNEASAWTSEATSSAAGGREMGAGVAADAGRSPSDQGVERLAAADDEVEDPSLPEADAALRRAASRPATPPSTYLELMNAAQRRHHKSVASLARTAGVTSAKDLQRTVLSGLGEREMKMQHYSSSPSLRLQGPTGSRPRGFRPARQNFDVNRLSPLITRQLNRSVRNPQGPAFVRQTVMTSPVRGGLGGMETFDRYLTEERDNALQRVIEQCNWVREQKAKLVRSYNTLSRNPSRVLSQEAAARSTSNSPYPEDLATVYEVKKSAPLAGNAKRLSTSSSLSHSSSQRASADGDCSAKDASLSLFGRLEPHSSLLKRRDSACGGSTHCQTQDASEPAKHCQVSARGRRQAVRGTMENNTGLNGLLASMNVLEPGEEIEGESKGWVACGHEKERPDRNQSRERTHRDTRGRV